MKVYEVPLTFADHHIDILYQVSVYRTIGSLVTIYISTYLSVIAFK